MWVSQMFAVAAASEKSGRVPALTLFDQAGRVAVLIDLALRSRVTVDIEGASIDTTPVGWAPADLILNWIDANPEASMQRMFERAPVRLRDLVPDEVVRNRSGWPRRGAPILSSATVASTRASIAQVSTSGQAESPAFAALALIANATTLVDTEHGDELLGACGAARTLVAATTAYLVELRLRLGLVAAAGTVGVGS